MCAATRSAARSRRSNAGGGPRVALVGHIDEIGLVVKHIDSSGVLFVGEIGTWDPAVLVGQRVTVTHVRGAVPGVMGKAARHLLSEEERKRVPLVHDLWVDIGARDATTPPVPCRSATRS